MQNFFFAMINLLYGRCAISCILFCFFLAKFKLKTIQNKNLRLSCVYIDHYLLLGIHRFININGELKFSIFK